MAEDDGELPPGMAPEGENDDDIRDDAAALFGVDLGDGDGGEGSIAHSSFLSLNLCLLLCLSLAVKLLNS